MVVLDNVLFILHGYDQFVVSQITFQPLPELLRLNTQLNTEEDFLRSIKFVKDYAINDIPILEKVCFVFPGAYPQMIEVVLQCQLETKESHLQALQPLLESARSLAQQATHSTTSPQMEGPSMLNDANINANTDNSLPVNPTPPIFPETESDRSADGFSSALPESSSLSPQTPLALLPQMERIGSPLALADSQSSADSEIEIGTAASTTQQQPRADYAAIDGTETASAVVSIPVTKIKGVCLERVRYPKEISLFVPVFFC